MTKTEANQRWLAKRPGYYAEWRAKNPAYSCWKSMIQRCTNPKAPNYALYGGRGIEVCSEWRTYEAFLRDMGPRPSMEHSLDRIDVDGDYEPGNVRWATRSEQQRNKRSTYPDKVRVRILGAWASGASCQDIADDLNADGVLSPQGRAWSRQLVRSVTKKDAAALG
jgi:hypothetical protein